MADRATEPDELTKSSLLRQYSAEKELHELARAQRQMLCQCPPEFAGYEQILAYRPAFFATGDYHDFFECGGGQAVFVGDGSGHGPTASIVMVTMRTILHTHPEIHTDPANTLGAACKMLHRLVPSDRFMTAIYLRMESDGWVSWASAGHHPPIWLRRPDRIEPLDLSRIGLPLAPWPEETYENTRWQLQVGDRMILFTDGLVEARNRDGVQLGRPFLEQQMLLGRDRPLREVVGRLLDQVNQHLAGADFEDDFTIVALERQEGYCI
ncbi:MAG TPA: PP2C family protein-serine/threonine phosphatase [Gemmataceae bacterium]|jgi:sigma-B regulation protein RsbU (phosphoserine phosphatase)|nr:PP2C family protein-serine/threonine phosphatase [Gemmataceae bacterium]